MGQTAEELLDSLTDEQIEAYTADPANEEHIVIGTDRVITVPASLKRIAVQFDHDIETVTFDCPRYWDGHDMSKMVIYINYLRSDNARGSYAATNVSVDDTDDRIMHFDWTISGNVTEVKGTLSFLVCVKNTVDGEMVNHWNSELNQEMTISAGLECSESIYELYPDLITELLLKMDDLGQLLVISDDGNGNVTLEGANTTMNIADTFSDKATYDEGDYVMFYGNLYKCVSPVTLPDIWRAANWKPVNIVDELKECFQFVSDGKTLIASAIIDMGVQTEATDTFSQMADNIRSIKTGVAAGGTAEVSDVTLGKTFINQTGKLLTGTSTAAADLEALTDDYNTLSAEKDELQNNYDSLAAEKQTLQANYNALESNYNALSSSYEEYKLAVVNGLAHSGLGVTSSTTASELEAILLAEFPAYTPYEVNFADYSIDISGCSATGDNTSAECNNMNGTGFYMQVKDANPTPGSAYGKLEYKLNLPTKNCNKVDITYSATGYDPHINNKALTIDGKSHVLTLDCTGDTFELFMHVTDNTGEHSCTLTITKISFYYE